MKKQSEALFRSILKLTVFPIMKNDEFTGSVAVARDITDRKKAEKMLRESEERYHAFFDQAADSIVLLDGETEAIVEFNEKAHKNLGYTREEFEKLKISDFEIIESDEEVIAHVKKIIKEGGDSFETKHKTKGGEIRNIHVGSRAISILGKDFILSIWRDITNYKEMEASLRYSKAHDQLEGKIRERTAELEKSKKKLTKEIEWHEKAEKILRNRERDLESKTNNLEELNAALNVLLDKREEDKIGFQNNMLLNVKNLILPYVDKLKITSSTDAKKILIAILESNLNEIVSPFARKLSSKLLNLSPTEIQVANLVKLGKTSKEIAKMSNVTTRTIAFHRGNIRKKLGIKKEKTNLKTYLMSIE